ncbi:MAG: pirin family protein [Leptospiraceae bacterium]|nr:pirin family protein [Leptospiraceae bacterium]
MAMYIAPYANQVGGEFDGGKILEKKPLGFPQEGGGIPYISSLFYWACAWSDEGGLIAEHPHQAFEIISFVLDGEIEHYDNKAAAWKKLKAGDVQIIRAGSGITHAERMNAGSRMFQIWFDPYLDRAVTQPPSYNDYRAEQFPVESLENGVEQTTLIGGASPFQMQSPVEVFRRKYSGGPLEIDLNPGEVMAMYALEGSFQFQDVQTPDGKSAELKTGDTFVWQPEESPDRAAHSSEDRQAGGPSSSDADQQPESQKSGLTQTLRMRTEGPAELFLIKMPVDPGYPLYTRRFQMASAGR